MRFNPHFPINTLQLMRGAVGVQSRMPERFVDYVTAVYESTWVEARNMGDLATVAEVLERVGFDARTILDLASDPAVKQALKDNTEEAVRRGAFGAPTMFVGQAMYFGQDRLDFVREALTERRRESDWIASWRAQWRRAARVPSPSPVPRLPAIR